MSVTPRGGQWQVYVKRKHPVTEEVLRYRLSAKTEAQAQGMEREIIAALDAGRPVDLEAIRALSESGKKTLAQAIDLAGRTIWRTNDSRETSLLNANLCARILGPSRAIDEIDADDIDTLVCELQAQGNSDATINRKMSALRRVFEVAEERKWCSEPPKLPHSKEGGGRIKWLTGPEEVALMTTTRRLGRHDFADLYMFLIDTGARAGEALSLTWRDVTDTHVTFWKTKNDAPRTVPLTLRLRDMFTRRPATQNPFPMTYAEARHTWDRVRTLLGYDSDPQWVMHILRHTCASRLVQRGVPLLVVKEWLGHKRIEMTMRYAHLAPSNLDVAVLALEPPAAPVAELVDAPGLGPDAERRGGSSPSRRTIMNLSMEAVE